MTRPIIRPAILAFTGAILLLSLSACGGGAPPQAAAAPVHA